MTEHYKIHPMFLDDCDERQWDKHYALVDDHEKARMLAEKSKDLADAWQLEHRM